MAIQTKLATRYWLKTVIMIVVCLVLGLWGVWDYVVKIPNDSRGFARAELLRSVMNGLDTPNGSSERDQAITGINLVQAGDSVDGNWNASSDS